MRTKTTVLTAAVLAAGALSSLAQNNVYSLNVVGYINVSLPNGYSLIANQLIGSPDNTLNSVLGTSFLSNMSVTKWNPATQGFNQPDTFYNTDIAPVASWYSTQTDAMGNPLVSTTTVSPGEGVFFFNPNPGTNVTLVGTVTQGTNAVTISAGYSFVSVVPPLSVDLATNGSLALPAITNGQYLTFNTAVGQYNQPFTYYDQSITGGAPGWFTTQVDAMGNPIPAQLIPAVGQGFLIFNPNNHVFSWVNTFSVQ